MSATNGQRTLLQHRRVTGLHESSHCVAAWLLGQPIERVFVRDAADIRAGEPAGQMLSPDRQGRVSLTDAICDIQVLLAGEAGARVAVVQEPAEQALAGYGVIFAEFEPTLEEIVEVPAGLSLPSERRITAGCRAATGAQATSRARRSSPQRSRARGRRAKPYCGG
jgi:hypothetical protein